MSMRRKARGCELPQNSVARRSPGSATQRSQRAARSVTARSGRTPHPRPGSAPRWMLRELLERACCGHRCRAPAVGHGSMSILKQKRRLGTGSCATARFSRRSGTPLRKQSTACICKEATRLLNGLRTAHTEVFLQFGSFWRSAVSAFMSATDVRSAVTMGTEAWSTSRGTSPRTIQP